MDTMARAGVDGIASRGDLGLPVVGPSRPVVRIHLLGAMRATSCLGQNVLPAGKRARAMLGYLCLAAGKDVDRTHVAMMLWQDMSVDTARTNLRQALRELSTAFGEFAPELIITSRYNVRFHVDACWIDALAARAFDPRTIDDDDDVAIAMRILCQDDLMDDLDGVTASFDDWLMQERIRVTERQRDLLEIAIPRVKPNSITRHALGRMLADARDRTTALAGYKRRSDVFREHKAHIRDRLRVGVLPFLVAGGTEREDDLAFSIAQDIGSALSRFRWFDSVPLMTHRPQRSRRYVDEKQLLNLQLDYIVDGTVAGRGAYLNISVRLMELGERVRHVWGEEFKLARRELHRLHELITTRIVARIDPVILFIEGQPKRRERFGATGLLLLAIPLLYSMERRKYEEGGNLIKQAYALDPGNSMAAAWVALWHLFYVGQGWAEDTQETLATVREYALKAVRLDPENAEALGIYAHCCAYGGKDFDTAIKYFDRALRLNPSLGFVWAYSALTYCYIGDPDTALRRLERYRELAPVDPYFSLFENAFTIAYTFKGDYEHAVLVGRRVVIANPDFAAGYKPLIASLGHLGRKKEAAPYVAKLLELEPQFTVERFGKTYPFKRTSDRRRYMRGLLLAGVPAR
jgi:tetratricopeptide (TPR) repeat protein